MATILVTGASGFLAGYLIPLLKNQNHIVVGLVRDVAGIAKVNNADRVYPSLETLTETESLFDYIFHLASFIPYGSMNLPNQRLITDNILLTAQLALFYPDARHVLSSSVAIYGKPLSLPLSVMSPMNQPDHYGLSKLAAESIIMNLRQYCIIRFSSIVGPGMKANSFVPILARDAVKNGTITLKGNGSRLQNYIDVRDAAQLCISAALNNFVGVLLGVAEQSVTNLHVAEFIKSVTKASLVFDGDDYSPSYSYQLEGNHQKIGFAPRHTIEQTLQDILDAMK